MKIVIDKIEANPPHAFSPRELREFLRLLPAELLRDVTLVRLSSAIEHSASMYVANFSRLTRRLVIISRTISRDVAMLAVIRCLVGCNWPRPSEYGQGPSELPKSDIERISGELLARLKPQMPSPPHWNLAELKYVESRRLAVGITTYDKARL